uniref:Uncharacterized protein n=1 Tax=Brugia timori TaxID=42155 RepID=A0A0R3RDG7_9BILA
MPFRVLRFVSEKIAKNKLTHFFRFFPIVIVTTVTTPIIIVTIITSTIVTIFSTAKYSTFNLCITTIENLFFGMVDFK